MKLFFLKIKKNLRYERSSTLGTFYMKHFHVYLLLCINFDTLFPTFFAQMTKFLFHTILWHFKDIRLEQKSLVPEVFTRWNLIYKDHERIFLTSKTFMNKNMWLESRKLEILSKPNKPLKIKTVILIALAVSFVPISYFWYDALSGLDCKQYDQNHIVDSGRHSACLSANDAHWMIFYGVNAMVYGIPLALVLKSARNRQEYL